MLTMRQNHERPTNTHTEAAALAVPKLGRVERGGAGLATAAWRDAGWTDRQPSREIGYDESVECGQKRS